MDAYTTKADEEKTKVIMLEVGIPELETKTPTYVLVQTEGEGVPKAFPLTRDAYIIGRSDTADITIDSSLLSRRHMLLEATNTGYRMVDLDSLNGVFLNGIRTHAATLCSGDVLQIGDVAFIYREAS